MGIYKKVGEKKKKKDMIGVKWEEESMGKTIERHSLAVRITMP